jgi:hypothetical protein
MKLIVITLHIKQSMCFYNSQNRKVLKTLLQILKLLLNES